jgi:uncharacterized protein (UPF0333 family)
MRLILLLISVIFVGFLLEKQFNSSVSDSEIEASSSNTENNVVPKAPQNQKDLLKLKNDLNNLILESADKRSKSIDQPL